MPVMTNKLLLPLMEDAVAVEFEEEEASYSAIPVIL